MLNVTINVADKSIPLPPVKPGQSRSLHDLTDGSLVLFTYASNENLAVVYRSTEGAHIEVGDTRVVDSYQKRLLAMLSPGKHFELPIQTQYGQSKVVFMLERDY